MSRGSAQLHKSLLFELGLLGVLTAGAFTVRLLRLLESPDPPGTDGSGMLLGLVLRGRTEAPGRKWALLVAGAWVSSRSVMLAALALVCVTRWGFDPTQTPPYARYRRLIERIPRPLPELLIAHQGINFL